MKTFTELQGGHVRGAETGVLRFAAGFLLLLNFPDNAKLHSWSHTHEINIIPTISSHAKAESPAQLATHRTLPKRTPTACKMRVFKRSVM